MGRKFQRKIEDFVCENCGTKVVGDGYTNHCPKCLFSKHVDNFPGDRENPCGGLMEPVDVEVRGNGKTIIFWCQKCGEIRRTKAREADDQEAITRVIERKRNAYGKN